MSLPVIKVKKLNDNAVVPKFMTLGAAGADLVAVSKTETADYIEYGTGLAFEIPEGWCGLLYSRSSISNKDLILANGVGLLDADYRGEVKFRFKRTESGLKTYDIGERIGQIAFSEVPAACFVEVKELSSTDRGSGGYGSTGK